MNVHAPEETSWVEHAAQGDRDAFARLVDRYWDKVRRFLLGMSGKNHLAEEVAQEAFLKAWTALPTLREPATFRVWLFQIARRCWVDARRRSWAHLRVPMEGELEGKHDGPLMSILDDESQAQLQAALALLPTKFRAAYLLWTQEEMPYAEIASILGISEETARWRVCKARQDLVHTLTAYLHQ